MKLPKSSRFPLVVLAATAAWCSLSSALCHAAAAPGPKHAPGPMLKRALEGPMAGVEEIIFAVRPRGKDPHWYVTFANYSDDSDQPQRYFFRKDKDGVLLCYAEGGRLCRLNLRTGKLKVLVDDPKGGVRDPQVHYDGKKILFSYRKGTESTFHLWEINSDGSRLNQLTAGPDDDIEPIYCPDGSIVFCSARCRRFVNCWYTRVASLYRCDGDGGGIRMLSSNIDHDNTPWMLPDGRIIYMRWEYVDRSQVHFHHLWTMNPDGTSQMVYFGNQVGGIVMIDAKPIPGTDKVVSSFSPGHGRTDHDGFVSVVDPSLGPDVPSMARNVSRKPVYHDPYAFSEDCFLVARAHGIYLMDGQGNTELVWELPPADRHMHCHEPRPLRSRRREPVIPPRTNLKKANGRLVLEDMYEGRKLESLGPGDVKKLLVLQQIPKPVNFSGGMQPLSIGGTFTLAKILGTVPVEADGSAYFEVPALQPVFFVALDENERAVKRMHSFLIVQPGETTSCVGCHEQRLRAPHVVKADLAALRRSPSTIQPIADVPEVIDFPRDVQPILDRRCVECHNPDKYEGHVDLSGDRTAMYSVSYWTMQTRNLVADGRNAPHGNRPPRTTGSARSRLLDYLDGSHYDVKLSDHEARIVRLWIDSSAPYPGTYASLGCGHYPVHLPVARTHRRCASCHVHDQHDPRRGKIKVFRFGQWQGHRIEPIFNLSRPEKSLVLRAPLAKKAGGLQLCKSTVFADTSDPLYRAMLGAIRDAGDRLAQGKRFDMAGFRPNRHYIREMQRFGFLPADLGPNEPIDVYAVDRAYWDSFDYRP